MEGTAVTSNISNIGVIINAVSVVIMLILIWVINNQKLALEKMIEELKNEVHELRESTKSFMTKELCASEHRTHDEKHASMKHDINGIGKKTEGLDIRLTELERAQS